VNPSFITVMLWTFAVLLVAVGIAQLVFTDSSVEGWGSIAIGMSLIGVAASTRKKSNNG